MIGEDDEISITIHGNSESEIASGMLRGKGGVLGQIDQGTGNPSFCQLHETDRNLGSLRCDAPLLYFTVPYCEL